MNLKLLHAAIGLYRRLPLPGLKRMVRRRWDRYQAGRAGRKAVATVEGVTYELHLDELIDSSIYYTGSFEPDTAAAIRRLVQPGFVALDIGANIGCHALRLARLVGEQGRVLAFEPMPWPRTKLKKNLSLNRFDNLTVVERGLSDSSRTEEVHFRTSWSVGASGRSFEAPGSMAKALVQFVRLDEYLAESRISRVDFIKLDVDGFEFKVLRGARKTLETMRPVILMELGAYTLAAVGDDIHEMVRYLEELGYRFYRETTFQEYPSTEAMIDSVPPEGTIDVVLSPHPLDG